MVFVRFFSEIEFGFLKELVAKEIVVFRSQGDFFICDIKSKI
jgi:hypothetical protein